MLQRQHGLDQAGDAGGRVEVADVGLDRADGAVAASRRAGAERPGQRGDLDRVAERRAGAVRLDVADASPVDAGRRPAPRRSPRPGRRRSGAVKPTFARAVVVDRRAADHGVDRVAVGAARRPAA